MKSLYDVHMADPKELDTANNAEFEAYYNEVAAAYSKAPDIYQLIGWGQMLVDLHPFATTWTVATHSDLIGKGEGSKIANIMQGTGTQADWQGLFDLNSIKNDKGCPNKSLQNQYLAHIEKVYQTHLANLGIAIK